MLQKFCDEISQNKVVFNISRISDNSFWLLFDKSGGFVLDLANKTITPSEKKPTFKNYTAPIDIWLSKSCSKVNIESAKVLPNDKIIEIAIISHNSYKASNYILRFEFIPPRGGFIVLDGNIVVSALRYDERIQVKKILKNQAPLPRPPQPQPEWAYHKSLIEILEQINQSSQISKLEALKKKKLEYIDDKIKKINEQLLTLESSEVLHHKSNEAFDVASFIASNMYLLEDRIDYITLKDTKLLLGFEKTIGEWKDFYYLRAKKLKQKAAGVYVRYENLNQKVHFWECFKNMIIAAKDETDITSIDPPKRAKGSLKDDDWHEVYIGEAKIMIGKNSIGNEKLLKLAKANDLWLHLQGVASAHVIVKGKGVKSDIINKAATLCVQFSATQKGTYLVDYTTRQNVSPVGGANVRYVNYKTVCVAI